MGPSPEARRNRWIDHSSLSRHRHIGWNRQKKDARGDAPRDSNVTTIAKTLTCTNILGYSTVLAERDHVLEEADLGVLTTGNVIFMVFRTSWVLFLFSLHIVGMYLFTLYARFLTEQVVPFYRRVLYRPHISMHVTGRPTNAPSSSSSIPSASNFFPRIHHNPIPPFITMY